MTGPAVDRLHVTFLGPFVPYDGIPHAGGRFLDDYLRRLAEVVDVTLIAPASELNREAIDRQRNVPPVELHLVPIRPRPRSKLGFGPRLLANTLAGVTPGWQVLRGFRADPWVWERVGASDLVELQWGWYLPFVRDIRRIAPGTPVTAFEHDVLTVSLRRRAREGAFHERTFGRVAAARARRVEPALLNRCDAIFTFSARDVTALRDLGVHRPVEVIDPPVGRPPPDSTAEKEPLVLFVGAMDRPENHEGAAWLAQRVWPEISAGVTEARLVLAGASPPASLRRLAGGTVSVPGHVEDLDALYRRASVFVAPNLTGAGVKFKVLDAMSHGLPVVATRLAAEGIADEDGCQGFAAVTDDTMAMAGAVVDLLRDRSRAAGIGASGRTWVGHRYDFARSVDRVLAIYRRLAGFPEPGQGPPEDGR